MRRFLLVITILMVVLGLLLGGALIALQLSSPTGNVGDEGIIAIPLLILLVLTTPAAFITGVIYFIAKRPKGRLTILPIISILFPLGMIACIPLYGTYKHNQSVITADEAIALVKQCEISDMQGANHKRWKLFYADNRPEDTYISSEDYQQVDIEYKKSESTCKQN